MFLFDELGKIGLLLGVICHSISLLLLIASFDKLGVRSRVKCCRDFWDLFIMAYIINIIYYLLELPKNEALLDF